MTNPFMKILYDEHEVIVNAIDVAKQLKYLINRDPDLYDIKLRKLIQFFRNYADKYHHYKEEVILFPEMNKRNEMLEEGIIKEMFENHEDFREMIKSIEQSLNAHDYIKAHDQLEKYTEELLNHIAVENEEVFQMAESIFDLAELEKIGHRFLDWDRELGDARKEEWKELADELRRDLTMMD
ncbi:MAG: hemerythrin domain-containing protein [Bacteroidota bacterium]|nr:hemerythrin domain-containing protein [Bacteroidota bacterium]